MIYFVFTVDKAMQMHKAIFRLPDRATVFFLQLLTAVACASCMHGIVDRPGTKKGWDNKGALLNRGTMQGLMCRKPTILQSATARWALRVLSVLSLLCGSR